MITNRGVKHCVHCKYECDQPLWVAARKIPDSSNQLAQFCFTQMFFCDFNYELYFIQLLFPYNSFNLLKIFKPMTCYYFSKLLESNKYKRLTWKMACKIKILLCFKNLFFELLSLKIN